MFQKIKDIVASSRVLQFALTLVAGVAIGAFFYPTKHIEETLKKKYELEETTLKQQHQKEMESEHEEYLKVAGEFHSYHDESEKKINTLTTQVTELRSKTKTSYYKLIKPDGTIEIKKFSESDVSESTKVVTQIQEEFKQKVDSIEKKWETIHQQRVQELTKTFDSKEQDYKHEIATLESKKVIDINPKKFGIEVGAMSSGNYYLHPTADIFGPVFIGVHGQMGASSAIGAGIGLRF